MIGKQILLSLTLAIVSNSGAGPFQPPSTTPTIHLSGELKQWHNVVLDFAGPFANETNTVPNPFTDYRFEVEFSHESGSPSYRVPGYFAADGNAAETSASEGNIWRAHLSPDKAGTWNYRIAFFKGPLSATSLTGEPVLPYHGKSGSFTVAPTDKTGRDFRSKGRLTYADGHYLHFSGTGKPFVKAGPDSPETLLAYADIDGTRANKKNISLKTWQPHSNDWNAGDPSWKDGKGKGLIGALNYLAETGVNSFSFLTYNAAGDGDNIWPFVERDEKFHYDCSKLDQWGMIFDHATQLGLHLHFKLQENENDDHRFGPDKKARDIPEALDGGKTGPERKLYFRELVARYGHHLALCWDLGEENTQTTEEQCAMAAYLAETDPYHHNIVIHTFPLQQDSVYNALLGTNSAITGASLQNGWDTAHQKTRKWIRASADAGRPWVVANDEQNPWHTGVPPDPGYRGYDHLNSKGEKVPYDLHDIRKYTLWGTLMAGGAGVEYLFGYHVAENDLNLEDFRSRDQSWKYCAIAINLFEQLPLSKMINADELVGNPDHTNSRYCYVQPGKLYLVYLPKGGKTELDLSQATGEFSLQWFNPCTGKKNPETTSISAGQSAYLSAPSTSDWLAVIKTK